MGDAKKPIVPGRVWRMSAEMPQGGFVDSLPSLPMQPDRAEIVTPAKILDPAQVPSWRASSHDLLTGSTVSDVTDTIPGELFDELFSRPES